VGLTERRLVPTFKNHPPTLQEGNMARRCRATLRRFHRICAGDWTIHRMPWQRSMAASQRSVNARDKNFTQGLAEVHGWNQVRASHSSVYMPLWR